MTLTNLCEEIHNWFDTSRHFGNFTIKNGEIDLSDLVVDGQYFRIVGSIFNDGVYQYPTSNLKDEVFNGSVWVMAVPPAVITLQTEIEEWEKKYEGILNSPYQSESFGGYSYTKSNTVNGDFVVSWRDHFRGKLNRWRKIRP